MSLFDYDALEALGIESVIVRYNGEGDEGQIEDITSTPLVDDLDYGSELYREIESQAYDVLENEHAGWEINEGSHGHITINVKERSAFLHHGENVVSTTWHDKNL